jgi:hypothetical protein
MAAAPAAAGSDAAVEKAEGETSTTCMVGIMSALAS